MLRLMRPVFSQAMSVEPEPPNKSMIDFPAEKKSSISSISCIGFALDGLAFLLFHCRA